MIQPGENISLKSFNTFGIDVMARWFATFGTQDELSALLDFQRTIVSPGKGSPATVFPGSSASPRPPKGRSSTLPAQPAAPGSASIPSKSASASSKKGSRAHLLILGGGSNLLFRGNFDGLVLKNEMKGIELIREDEKYVYVRVGAGESWHGFVQYCLQRNWAGVENLSLIPGSVGAAPMQNIGAYGVEIKEVFYELEAWDLHEGKIFTFSLNDCEFGYRESVFKRRLKDRAIILNVTLRLNKVPKFHTEYGAIREELDKMGVQQLSIQAISQAVIRIRSSKLPDPKQIGNAGSFFKNPTVSGDRFAALKAAFPGIPGYPSTLPPLQPSESAAATSSQSSQVGSVPAPASTLPPSSPAPAGSSTQSLPTVPPPQSNSPSSGTPRPSSQKQPPPSSGSTPPSSQASPPPAVKLAAGWLIEQCGWKGFRRGDAGCHALQALVLVNYGQASGEEIYDLSEEILLSVKKKFGVELEREVNII